jgi:hypothetical protein
VSVLSSLLSLPSYLSPLNRAYVCGVSTPHIAPRVQLGLAGLVSSAKLPPETLTWLASPESTQSDAALREIPGLANWDPVPFAAAFTAMFAGICGVSGAHDVGHAVAARLRGIKLGPTLFVPNGSLGTFGSVTRPESAFRERSQLWDFAAAGPVLGLAAGAALFAYGLQVRVSLLCWFVWKFVRSRRGSLQSLGQHSGLTSAQRSSHAGCTTHILHIGVCWCCCCLNRQPLRAMLQTLSVARTHKGKVAICCMAGRALHGTAACHLRPARRSCSGVWTDVHATGTCVPQKYLHCRGLSCSSSVLVDCSPGYNPELQCGAVSNHISCQSQASAAKAVS